MLLLLLLLVLLLVLLMLIAVVSAALPPPVSTRGHGAERGEEREAAFPQLLARACLERPMPQERQNCGTSHVSPECDTAWSPLRAVREEMLFRRLLPRAQ